MINTSYLYAKKAKVFFLINGHVCCVFYVCELNSLQRTTICVAIIPSQSFTSQNMNLVRKTEAMAYALPITSFFLWGAIWTQRPPVGKKK